MEPQARDGDTRSFGADRMPPEAEGSTWPVAVLTSAFCPEFDPQRLAMAMCVGYFEGQESQEATSFRASGFVAAKTRWRDFEARWSRLLHREGLTAFNADDFVNSRNRFVEWVDPAQRRSLLDALGRLVEQHVFRAFSQSINLADYHAINADCAFAEAVAGPYGVCAALLMRTVRQWLAAKHPDGLTLFVFEQGDLEQRELQRLLQAEYGDVGEPAQMWPRQWRDERGRSRYLRPLEACELYRADVDGLFLKRLKARSLIDERHVGHEQLEQICQVLNVPRRLRGDGGKIRATVATR